MKKLLLMVLSFAFVVGPVVNVNAVENDEQTGISMECELLNKDEQTYKVKLHDEEFTITVEDVPIIHSRNAEDVTLGSSFSKRIGLSNGVLKGEATFKGTTNSTQGKVTDVGSATLNGPLITGVSWQKNFTTFNNGTWGVGQAIFSYSFIVVGGSTSMTLQLTAKPNGKGVIALF